MQRPTKEVIRQRFRNLTECKDEEEITYYLEFHKMNLHEAVCSYQSDTRWEADHFAKRVVSHGLWMFAGGSELQLVMADRMRRTSWPKATLLSV